MINNIPVCKFIIKYKESCKLCLRWGSHCLSLVPMVELIEEVESGGLPYGGCQ